MSTVKFPLLLKLKSVLVFPPQIFFKIQMLEVVGADLGLDKD